MKKTSEFSLRRFISPIKKQPAVYIKWIIRSFFTWLYMVRNVLALQYFVSQIEQGDSNLWNFFVLYLIITVLYHIIRYYMRLRWRPEINNFWMIHIHGDMMKEFIDLDNNSIETLGSGKLIAIIRTGLHAWKNLLAQIIDQIGRIIVSLIFSMYIVLSLGGRYGLWFIVLFIVMIIIVIQLDSYAQKHRKLRQIHVIEHTRHIVKIIASKFEILQNNKIDREIDRLDDHFMHAHSHSIPMSNYLYYMYNIPRIIIFVAILAAMYYGIISLQQGTLSIALFVWIMWAISIADNVMNQVVDIYKQFMNNIVDVYKLRELVDDTPRIRGMNTGKKFTYQSWHIAVENISFAYGTSTIFENFSCTIQWWKKTALVWQSGSGKSTLIKLLAWFLHTDQWDISIDKQSLNTLRLQDYYKHIGYLTQEPSIFDGTIRDNLTYWSKKKLSHNEIETVITHAKCEFIYDFETWLDTEIGERWIKLSWWQRQRLAIAKIMLKNPEIILLDEPTSALDSFSEEHITEAMHNLFEWRTVIIVAHRLQTVKEADEIIVLENWAIVERWTHKQLEKKNGTYKKMLELQTWF